MKQLRRIGVGVGVATAAYGFAALGALTYAWCAARDVGAYLPDDATDDEEPESLYVHVTDEPATDGIGFFVVDTDDDQVRRLIERFQECVVGAPPS